MDTVRFTLGQKEPEGHTLGSPMPEYGHMKPGGQVIAAKAVAGQNEPIGHITHEGP